jgi:hypothetical protein
LESDHFGVRVQPVLEEKPQDVFLIASHVRHLEQSAVDGHLNFQGSANAAAAAGAAAAANDIEFWVDGGPVLQQQLDNLRRIFKE